MVRMSFIFVASLMIVGSFLLVETIVEVRSNSLRLLPTSSEAIIVDTITGYFRNLPRNEPVVVNLGAINLLFGPLPIEVTMDNLRIYGTEDVVVNNIRVSNVPPNFEFDFSFPKLQFETDESPAQYVAKDRQSYPVTLGTWMEAFDTRLIGRADYIAGASIQVENVKTDLSVGNVKTKLTASFPEGEYTIEMKQELERYEEMLRLRQLDAEVKILELNVYGLIIQLVQNLDEEIDALRDLYTIELDELLNRNLQTMFNTMFL